MAVKIRLRRVGKKKQPYYRIVVTDSRNPRDGRFIETIGYYHPVGKNEDELIKLSREKYDDWIKKGAKPSESLKNLIKSVK